MSNGYFEDWNHFYILYTKINYIMYREMTSMRLIFNKIVLVVVVFTILLMGSLSSYSHTNQGDITSVDNASTIGGSIIKVDALPTHDGVINAGEYDHQTSFSSGVYNFYYTIDHGVIYMALSWPSTGWGSIGFGPGTSSMQGDAYTGYYDNGGFVSDYWSIGKDSDKTGGYAVPIPDSQNDIISYGVTEDTTKTYMEWSRLLNTGDTAQDYEILPGVSTGVMVAYRGSNEVGKDNPNYWHKKTDARGTITFQGSPANPTNLGTTFSQSQVSLSWTAPLGNYGFSPLTTCNIYRAEEGGDFVLYDTVSASSNSYVDNTVTNGVQYRYKVTYSNGIGESGFSNEVTVRPMGNLLPAQNLQAIVTSKQVSLSWAYPSSDGGIPVARYKVYRNSQLIGTNTSNLGYVDNNVINGYQYQYFVLAEHAFLTSTSSNIVVTNPVGPATQPLDVIANYGENQVMLNWTAPLSDGGSALGNYSIYRCDNIDGTYSKIDSTSNLYYNDSTTSNGQTYYYKITVNNSYGEGDPSDIQKITLDLVPSQPQNLAASSGAGYVYLTWDIPDGKGYPINLYNIFRADDKYSAFKLINNSTVASFNDTSVVNSNEYFYMVTAVNEVGESSFSNKVISVPSSISSAPTSVVAEFKNDKIRLTWEEPIENGGYFISEYKVYRDGNPYRTSKSKELVDINFKYATEYSYEISAVNAIGESVKSEAVTVTPTTVPDAPANLQQEVINGDVSLSWDVPINDGGKNITEYFVYRSIIQGGSYELVSTSETNNYLDSTNTTNTYYYVVTAVNINGESEKSNEVDVLPADAPSVPVNIVGIANFEEAILIWDEPVSDGGLVIQSYNIYKSDDNIEFKLVESVEAMLYSDLDVENNVTYYYRLTAVNSLGESELSETIEITPKEVKIDESILNSANDGNNTLMDKLNMNEIINVSSSTLAIIGGAIGLVFLQKYLRNLYKKRKF